MLFKLWPSVRLLLSFAVEIVMETLVGILFFLLTPFSPFQGDQALFCNDLQDNGCFSHCQLRLNLELFCCVSLCESIAHFELQLNSG